MRIKETKFEIISEYKPKGDQPQAIDKLVQGIENDEKHQVLLGITGSGKTFTIANVIARVNRPTLLIAHNKTLAAQLFAEMTELFPDNAVEYFVSYYDYYQPEAYVPTTDTYIEKDSAINDKIDRLRHSATRALLSRKDVIVVASVSCIYGIGAQEDYQKMLIPVEVKENLARDQLMRKLVDVQYQRNDMDFARGTFRVRGDVVEIFPVYEEEKAIRIEFWGDEVERISEIDPFRGNVLERKDNVVLFPGSHYVTPRDKQLTAMERIRQELRERLQELDRNGKLVEKQRLAERTMQDMEMLEQTGHCNGIENYSRHFDGRLSGEPPTTLIDYFPKDFLTIIDESHQTIPQIGAMYKGDHSRKSNLVEYGFRLPSAMDNRPLKFEEFEKRIGKTIFVSATPAEYELEKAAGAVIEQVIRPTGLLDPETEVRPAGNQVDDLLDEVRERVEKKQRVLITTLTKRSAEDLTEYYAELGIKVKYLHSDVDTLERIEIIRELRKGTFDVLVGINLLREGLDIPEVSLVAIFDADKEGFLRSTRSLIQIIGRAARNAEGKVIMYADKITDSMRNAIEITERRREKQTIYNELNNITPKTINKKIEYSVNIGTKIEYQEDQSIQETANEIDITSLREEMIMAAESLDFEKAAKIRDRLRKLVGHTQIISNKDNNQTKRRTKGRKR